MKKAIYTGIIIVSGILSFTSCKKVYHCSCTFNNTLVYNKDLGNQTLKNAKTICDRSDTMMAGEIWTCTVN